MQYNVLDLYKTVATHFFWEIKMQWSATLGLRYLYTVYFKTKFCFVLFQWKELYTLLIENYVEDDDNMFCFDYSPEFLQWLVMLKKHTPTLTDLHLGRLCLESHVLSLSKLLLLDRYYFWICLSLIEMHYPLNELELILVHY